MQTIFISLQTDNHTNASSLNVYRPDAFPDAQQCQSTEDKSRYIKTMLCVYYIVIRVTAIIGVKGSSTRHIAVTHDMGQASVPMTHLNDP